MNSFYSNEELKELGLRFYGKNVLISKKSSIYGAEEISIGNNVRIDDFCILSGKIDINNYIHIAAYTALYGGDKGIYIDDFANISSKVSIYSISDDYSGETITNPMVPDKYRRVINGKVIIQRHVIIGCGSVILPGVTLKEGSAFGAISLVNKDSNEWSINAGIPFKELRKRSRKALQIEQELLKEVNLYEQ